MKTISLVLAIMTVMSVNLVKAQKVVVNIQKSNIEWLGKKVLGEHEGNIQMKAGAIIEYKLRIHGIPLTWVSEIVEWDPPHRFTDKQIKGPYRLWIHEHRFTERDGETLAVDNVRYAVPGGALAHKLLVEKDIKKIFDYREDKLKELFPG